MIPQTIKPAIDATISGLARETSTPPAVVFRLYEKEIAALSENAKIKPYIDVIATRLVRQRLRELRTH